MWLALAKLETYENARAVLNKARQALPHEYSIWVHAAKLEESEGKPINNIQNIIARGMQVLTKNSVKIKREDWINEAILAEKSSNPLTAAAIIKLTIANVIEGLDEEDKQRVWLEEAEMCDHKANPLTARAIFSTLTEQFPSQKQIWVKSIDFERRFQAKLQTSLNEFRMSDQQLPTEETKLKITEVEQRIALSYSQLNVLLKGAINYFPLDSQFWLLSAKISITQGKLEEAQKLLDEGLQKLPYSEEIYLQLSKLNEINGNLVQAKEILTRAREFSTGVRIWLQSVKFELKCADQRADEASIEKLVREICEKFHQEEKV
eukprot:TRINITY_DN5611_c0_g1_i3.p1 TRINITY_DN5611_c0_g1~~TRINITY_DN5611_c0_g1_i3.p1  ORF type:complete len:320 (+),score=39.93 TRINITY_DN5611_c0_g1_i3:583-1542(+)